jgi:hypothetical protein
LYQINSSAAAFHPIAPDNNLKPREHPIGNSHAEHKWRPVGQLPKSVAQAFQPAGSRSFPASSSKVFVFFVERRGFDSSQNRQTEMLALRIHQKSSCYHDVFFKALI